MGEPFLSKLSGDINLVPDGYYATLNNIKPGTALSSAVTLQQLNDAVFGSGSGTVTSFGAGNLSGLFETDVFNPTTTPGLTFTLYTQQANKIFAGPITGSDDYPSFRSLVSDDIPDLSLLYLSLTASALTPNNILQTDLNGAAVASGWEISEAFAGVFYIDPPTSFTNASIGQLRPLTQIFSTTVFANTLDSLSSALTVNGANIGTGSDFGFWVDHNGGNFPAIGLYSSTTNKSLSLRYNTSSNILQIRGDGTGKNLGTTTDWLSISGTAITVPPTANLLVNEWRGNTLAPTIVPTVSEAGLFPIYIEASTPVLAFYNTTAVATSFIEQDNSGNLNFWVAGTGKSVGFGINYFSINSTGFISYIDGNQAAGKVLVSDSMGLATWQDLGGYVTGLTANYIPYAVTTDSLGDSHLSFNLVATFMDSGTVLQQNGGTANLNFGTFTTPFLELNLDAPGSYTLPYLYIDNTYGIDLYLDGTNYISVLKTNEIDIVSPLVKINGGLRYTDGSEAAGYILTSDASGNATWAAAGGTIGGAVSINRVPYASAANTLANSFFEQTASGWALDSGRYITSQDVTKTRIDFGTTGAEYFRVFTEAGNCEKPYIYLDSDVAEFFTSGNIIGTGNGIKVTQSTNTMLFRAQSAVDIQSPLVTLNDGNLAFGTTSGDGTRSITMTTGGVPTIDIADSYQVYCADIVAGNAAMHVRTELGDIVKIFADSGWGTPTGTFTKTTFDTSTASLQDVAERLAAVIDTLKNSHQLFKA